MAQNNIAACPVCESTEHLPLLFLENVPVMCNTLFSSPEEAKNARVHDIELCCCCHCSHIHNIRFDPDRLEYRQGYENSLFYSPRYREYAEGQAQRLITTYALRGKRVVDIGCGNGEFLQLLHRAGKCMGIGFDPTLGPDADAASQQTGIRLIADTFPENFPEQGDLYVARHVLEHLHEPVVLLQNIHNAMGTAGSVLYLELPDGEHLLTTCSVWDIIYEHYSSFTPRSLMYILERTAFSVNRLQSDFQGQYLAVDAAASAGPGQPSPLHYGKKKTDDLFAAAEKFAGDCRKKIEQEQNMLEKEQQAGKRMVVWGAGSKGITFLNQMNSMADIAYVADINPQKQGKYIPGTGQQVVAPEFLSVYKADIILIANEIYRDEIIKSVMQLDISPQFICI